MSFFSLPRNSLFLKFLVPYRVEILALIFYSLVGAIYTYPVIFKMRSIVYGVGGDPLGTVWHFWLLKNIGIWNFASITPLIAYPFGYDLSLAPHQLSGEFLGWLLAFIVDEVFAYNLILFISYPLAGIFMYLLGHYLTGSRPGSFIAGLIYTVSSYHTHHAIGHLLLSTIQWMPLYILCLLRLDEERNYKYALFTGLTFSLVSLDSFYHGLFMVVVTVTFLCYRLVSEFLRKKCLFISYRAIKLSIAVIATIFFTTLPAIYSILRNIIASSPSTGGYSHPISDLYVYSSRPWEYLIPSIGNPLLGKYASDFIRLAKLDLHGSNHSEQTIFLGYSPILLTMGAVFFWFKDRWKEPALDSRIDFTIRFFSLVAIVAFLFSLPPTLEFWYFNIHMPSFFIYKFIQVFRCYVRFAIVITLAIALLAGVGTKFLLNGKRVCFKTAITFLLTLLTLFEFFYVPGFYPAFYKDIKDIPLEYKWLAEQRGNLIIVEYPLVSELEGINSDYLFWQRVHKKTLVNGAVRGSVADKFRERIIDLNPSTVEQLRKIGVDYLVVHTSEYPDSLTVDGLRLIKSFDSARIYWIEKENDPLLFRKNN